MGRSDRSTAADGPEPRVPRAMGHHFELEVDRVIREAVERGEFDDLPGVGKPIPGAGERDDEMWWVRNWVTRQRDDGEEGS